MFCYKLHFKFMRFEFKGSFEIKKMFKCSNELNHISIVHSGRLERITFKISLTL